MDTPDLSHLFLVDHSFVINAGNIAEALSNLHYLICMDAADPVKVRSYSDQIGERVRALGVLLHSILPEQAKLLGAKVPSTPRI
jgi:hypothetical protein